MTGGLSATIIVVIISHSHRFVFVKTKKTAGTSIEVYLSPLLDPNDVVTPVGEEEASLGHAPRNYQGRFSPFGEALSLANAPRSWRAIDGGGALRSFGHAVKGKRYYNHISAYRTMRRMGAKTWSKYLTFAVERNPWDKAISQFFWKARRRPDYSFEQFVTEEDVGINYPRYCDPHTGEILVDRLLYYHRLNEELTKIFEEIQIPFSGKLDVRAKGNTRKRREPYQKLFNGELARYRPTIDRLFAKEIELHGWDFESGLPHRGT